jgi:hypothetical protein
MKKLRLSRYYLLLCVPVLVALVGLLWGRPVSGPSLYNLCELNGRYVSAEYAYDISSVHTEGDTVGPPIWFATSAVMQADGRGNVCGESDGFYSLMTSGQIPGGNLGPSYFHGTYTVDANGRVTVSTCSDSGFCATRGPCAPVTKVQVGYLQSPLGTALATVEQEFGASFSSGFLVHSRVWTRDPLAIR